MPTRSATKIDAPNCSQLHGAHEGEDDADQETDQRDDAESVGAAILDRDHQIDPPITRAAGHEPAKRDRHRSEERNEAADRLGVGDGRGAYALDQRRASRSGTRVLRFGNGLGQFDQPPESAGKTRGIDRHVARMTEFEHFRDEGDKAAIPLAQARGVERDPPWNRRPRQFALDRRARGKPSLQVPIAGQTRVPGCHPKRGGRKAVRSGALTAQPACSATLFKANRSEDSMAGKSKG